MLTDKYPKVNLSHTPTPIERLSNLSDHLHGPNIWVKRDDNTGLAMGGNKARQLEYYIGDAIFQGADTLLTTGAVQSNHVRMTIAAARKLGLEVEVQLESRVSGRQAAYYDSGNVMLMKLMGAKIHYYPEGEDEEGADKAMYQRAQALRETGANPYVVPLAADHIPYGALGYVNCAEEILLQIIPRGLTLDGIVLASGSATTHSGLLAGLRALGSDIPVYGFCVRRDQHAQSIRVKQKTEKVLQMIDMQDILDDDDIWVRDSTLAPGYGQINEKVERAIRLSAYHEGLLLDPTYTAKAMAGLLELIEQREFFQGQNVLFLHTGGTPALFGYPELVT